MWCHYCGCFNSANILVFEILIKGRFYTPGLTLAFGMTATVAGHVRRSDNSAKLRGRGFK